MIESWISTAIVWAWTLLAVVGAAFSIWGLRKAREDRAWLRANRLNGARTVVTGATVRRESVRILMHVLFFTSGILVLLTPLPHGALTGMVGVTRLVFRFTTLAAVAFQTENSILDARVRVRIGELEGSKS